VAAAWRGMPIAARQALISLMEGGFAEPITSAKIKQRRQPNELCRDDDSISLK
jgi:hypothetical protein